MKILLLLSLLFLIISPINYLFAQAQKEVRDPFLSITDRIKVSKEPFDISKLPYSIDLNGIIWTQNLRTAIINNEAVEEGQMWRDLKVEKIEKEKVILKLGNRRFEVPLILEKKDEQKKD